MADSQRIPLVQNIHVQPEFCQYSAGPCDQEFVSATRSDVLFLYPSRPEAVSSTIEDAVVQLSRVAGNRRWITWKNLDVPGQIIFCEICKAIRFTKLAVADITTLNFNLLFEIGFSLGLGVPVLPIRDTSHIRDVKDFEELGIFDTYGFLDYHNSAELRDGILSRLGAAPLSLQPPPLNVEQPLYVVKSPFENDGMIKLMSVIKKSRLRFRTFDSKEIGRISLHEAYKQVVSSRAVILHLLSGDIRGAHVHNARCAFLAGMGMAAQKRVLMKKIRVWVGRWREDVIENGCVRRIERSDVLGSKSDFPTKRLALRELAKRLAVANDPRYRARPTARFEEFASRWESSVLTQFKPSTQVTIRSHLRKHLVPFFGRWQMREIGPEEVQRFISSVKASPKTVKNLFATMQMLWKSARTWGYVAHDAVSGVALPKRHRVARRFFSIEEVQRILEAAPEPYRTFYWLAVETGMRAGELCGLRVVDFDFERGQMSVRQSVWRGKFQSPKSENAVRTFALSPGLLAHMADHLKRWKPNERDLLFATRNGTPWDANLLVKRKLYPMLDSLGIVRGGLHAFRHTNSTLMDRLNVPLKVRQQRLGHSESLSLSTCTRMLRVRMMCGSRRSWTEFCAQMRPKMKTA